MSVDNRPPNKPDAEWIEESVILGREGDDSAIGRILAHYREYLLAIAQEEMSSDLAAKVAPSDIVQETCLQASQAFRGFRGKTEAELRAWLRKILTHNFLDARKRFRGTDKRDLTRERPLDVADGLTADGSLPQQDLLLAEAQAKVRLAITSLPEDHRKIIQLRNFEYRSFQDIAQEMGRSLGAVQQLWSRAIDHLSEILANDDSSLRSGI